MADEGTPTIDDVLGQRPQAADGRYGLESKVNSSIRGKAWSLLKAAAFTYTGFQFAGINAFLSGVAFAAGSAFVNMKRKVKNTLANSLNEYSVGTVMGAIGSYFYDTIYKMFPMHDWASRIYRALINILPATVAWIGSYFPVNYIIKNDRISIRGIASDYRDYGRTFKDTVKWLGLPLALTINYPPQFQYLSYPSIVASDMAWRVIKG